MKLFSEKLTKLKFLLFLTFSILEIICFLILFISYKPLYLKVFNQEKKASIEKTDLITNNLNEILRLSLDKYLLDLKLAGKHISFLGHNKINNNSQYYQNVINNEDKHIFFGTIEELKINFSEYYNEEDEKFLYKEKYMKDYIENNSNQINALNDLMDKAKHPELNSISFYKENGTIKDIENKKMKKVFIKYLISILKTNYIKRFLVKGYELELDHYFLLTKEELYIYPPEPFIGSMVYKLKDIYYCGNNNSAECVYDKIIDILETAKKSQNLEGERFPIIPITHISFENITNVLCLNMPFDEAINFEFFTKSLLLCAEINITKIFSNNLFKIKPAFNFVLFFENENDKIPIYTDRIEIFDEIRKVFNDSKFQKFSLNSDYHLYFKHFDFFQFFYIDLFKEPSLFDKYNISLDELFDEFKIIETKILDSLDNFNITRDEYITLDIQKTTCKTDIYYNGEKCLKDDFMIIIHPLKSYFHLINEFFIDESNIKIQQILFYSMSVISDNYKYIKWKINLIIIFKIIKLFFFYFISALCFITLYFIFVQIFYNSKYNSINQILNIINDGSFFFFYYKNEIIQKNKK